jgi:hypothetical protein
LVRVKEGTEHLDNKCPATMDLLMLGAPQSESRSQHPPRDNKIQSHQGTQSPSTRQRYTTPHNTNSAASPSIEGHTALHENHQTSLPNFPKRPPSTFHHPLQPWIWLTGTLPPLLCLPLCDTGSLRRGQGQLLSVLTMRCSSLEGRLLFAVPKSKWPWKDACPSMWPLLTT